MTRTTSSFLLSFLIPTFSSSSLLFAREFGALFVNERVLKTVMTCNHPIKGMQGKVGYGEKGQDAVDPLPIKVKGFFSMKFLSKQQKRGEQFFMFCNVITLAGINLFLMVLFYNLEEYIAFVVYYQMFFTIPPSQRMLGGEQEL